MKTTLRTTAGVIDIQAAAGLVKSNGATLLPHEAMLLAGALEDAARAADRLATAARLEAELKNYPQAA
jgi:hypothetical protein